MDKKYLKLESKVNYDPLMPGSLTYVASYITAAARRLGFDFITKIGLSNLIYSDTDSFIVKPQCVLALKE